jgi:hypothetical protein
MSMQGVEMQIQRCLGLGVVVDLALGHRERPVRQEIGAHRTWIVHRRTNAQFGDIGCEGFCHARKRELAHDLLM